MKGWRLGSVLMAAYAVCSGAEPAQAPDPDLHAADRALAKQLATELKTALTKALQVSPESAIGVCKTRAPQIAAKISAENAVTIGRTSLRVRNPANAPSAWQREVLEEFQRRTDAGEVASAMEYSAVIEADGYTAPRYMKAIVTEPLCVTCHGQQLSPAVKQAIAAKYPADAATGFSVGDLRGAVYVVRHLREQPKK
ncbi:MAG: DUF3365 domain-containing protein [Lysobacterales bacterium]|nr:MAG: DUF3365 domain-containing protein [Xanthomonadales bacterium]